MISGRKWTVVNGVLTGGIVSVDFGNISLYVALKNVVYSNDVKPDELKNLDRFVDDILGQGMWDGSMDRFEE